MSTVKTKVDQKLVLSFLESYFNGPISELTYIDGGEGSQAFSFCANDAEYIIRVNTRNYSFLKDLYASKNFRSEKIPVPRIVEIGMIDDKYYYAISEKAPGRRLDKLSQEEQAVILPKLFETIEIIHSIDVSNAKGYGEWNAKGQAPYKSWNEFVTSIEGRVTGKHDGPNLFETTILEKEVWERVYAEITTLLPFCSEDRTLLHGDCGFDNVLSDGSRITGVIDWGESMYGDFLYDYAWLSYWSNDRARGKTLKEYYFRKNINHTNFDERMRCYELHIGLGALGFYAFSEQKDKYEWNKERLLKLLYKSPLRVNGSAS